MADDAALLEALRDVVDPELMINIVDLGLIYDVEQVDNKVTVNMTLTSPACPAGPQIIQQAKMALEKLADVSEAEIKLVMSPPWSPDRMTDERETSWGSFRASDGNAVCIRHGRYFFGVGAEAPNSHAAPRQMMNASGMKNHQKSVSRSARKTHQIAADGNSMPPPGGTPSDAT